MYTINIHPEQKSVWFVVRASVVSACIVAGSLLTACQAVQPVEDVTESEGIIFTGAVASPEAAGSADVDDASADAVAAEVDVPAEEDAPAEADAPQEANQPDPALVEAGMAVYRAQYCGICHTFTAAGTTGTFGPPHDGLAETAALRILDARYTGAAETAEDYVYESIVKPAVYTVEGYVGTSHAMPPYTHLPEEDVRALVALLMAGR